MGMEKIWILLVCVCLIVACDKNESEECIPCSSGDAIPQDVDVVPVKVSVLDSAFFYGLLPSLERNKVLRIDSREDILALFPSDTLQFPDDLDFERYTYVLGCVELCSPYYYVKRDTLVYASGYFRYDFDYFYSPADSNAMRLICRKYEKLPEIGTMVLDVDGERGLGIKYSADFIGSTLYIPDIDIEKGTCVLIKEKQDFFCYMTQEEYFRRPFLHTIDFSKYSAVLWVRYVDYSFKGFDIRMWPLSPVSYRYECTAVFGEPSVLPGGQTEYYVSIIDKIPDGVSIDFVMDERHE